jgi:hypothetical protein
MQYFTDGLDGLIRVDSDEPRESREFFFAVAEKLGADGAWHRLPTLILEILNGGYYRPATDEELDRLLIPTPAALMAQLIRARTFTSGTTTSEPVLGSIPLLTA